MSWPFVGAVGPSATSHIPHPSSLILCSPSSAGQTAGRAVVWHAHWLRLAHGLRSSVVSYVKRRCNDINCLLCSARFHWPWSRREVDRRRRAGRPPESRTELSLTLCRYAGRYAECEVGKQLRNNVLITKTDHNAVSSIPTNMQR